MLSFKGSTGEGYVSKLVCVVLAGLRSPRAAGQWQKVPATWTLHRQLTTWQLGPLTGRREARQAERVPKRKATGFCHLMSEVTSRHFCDNLFIGSRSPSPSRTQRDVNIRTCHTGEACVCGLKANSYSLGVEGGEQE